MAAMGPDASSFAPPTARDKVLTAADRLFYQRGIRAVGINEIVASAGVAKTSLYLHFASKDDLVAAYLAGRTALYRGSWNAVLQATADLTVEERLDRVFEVLAQFVASEGYRGCPFVNAAAELPDTDHPGYEAILEYRRFVREELFGAIARTAGVSDPDALAAELQVLYDGSLAGSVIEGSAAPVERAKSVARALVAAAHGS